MLRDKLINDTLLWVWTLSIITARAGADLIEEVPTIIYLPSPKEITSMEEPCIKRVISNTIANRNLGRRMRRDHLPLYRLNEIFARMGADIRLAARQKHSVPKVDAFFA